MTSQAKLLQAYLEETGSDVDGLAEAIGDDPQRLRRVIDGQEELGLTAALAFEAFRQNLPEIEPGD